MQKKKRSELNNYKSFYIYKSEDPILEAKKLYSKLREEFGANIYLDRIIRVAAYCSENQAVDRQILDKAFDFYEESGKVENASMRVFRKLGTDNSELKYSLIRDIRLFIADSLK